MKSDLELSSAFAVSVLARAPIWAISPLAQTDCSLQRSLENHAYTLRAAAKWLGIITVVVLLIAGSVGSVLVARDQCHWSVASLAA